MSYYATISYDIGEFDDEDYQEMYTKTTDVSSIPEVLEGVKDVLGILRQYAETVRVGIYQGYNCIADLEFDELEQAIQRGDL